jgi:hypothetical protein
MADIRKSRRVLRLAAVQAENSMAPFAFAGTWLRSRCAGLALAMAAILVTSPVVAQAAGTIDPRSGTVRIYVSLATSAMTRLVAAVGKHFPNLKIEFVRAGSVETV